MLYHWNEDEKRQLREQVERAASNNVDVAEVLCDWFDIAVLTKIEERLTEDVGATEKLNRW